MIHIYIGDGNLTKEFHLIGQQGEVAHLNGQMLKGQYLIR